MKKQILLALECAKARLMHAVLTMDASYPKDPDPDNWRTINGSHVHLENGKINGGAGGKFSGNDWTGKVMHKSDTRAQERSLFGSGWSVPESKSEKEQRSYNKKIEEALQDFHKYSTSYDPNHSMQVELKKQEKLFNLLQNADPTSKIYKKATGYLDIGRTKGSTEKDLEERKQAETEKEKKLGESWMSMMKQNENPSSVSSPLESIVDYVKSKKTQKKGTFKSRLDDFFKKQRINLEDIHSYAGQYDKRGLVNIRLEKLAPGKRQAFIEAAKRQVISSNIMADLAQQLLKGRLDSMGRESSAASSSSKSTGLYNYDISENRCQFKFDGKPSDDVRSILKANGFRWSPSRQTWVRQATANGIRAAKTVQAKLDDIEGSA